MRIAKIILSVVLLCAASLRAETPSIEAWVVVLQVMGKIHEHIAAHELTTIHDEDMPLQIAVSSLLRESANTPADKRNDLQLALTSLGWQVADLHAAADANDAAKIDAQIGPVDAAVQKLTTFYDEPTLASARALAERYTCPMHANAIGKKGDPCPFCGMPLDQLVRPSLFQPGKMQMPAPTIRATANVDSPLKIGERKYVTIHLAKIFGGDAISPADLRETHTQKVHLLIVDRSLTDYHHEHPLPAQTAGDYAFSFTPQKPGPYRVWADLRSVATGFQEYAMTDIPGEGTPEQLADKATKLHAEVEGLRYDLSFEKREIKAGQPINAKLRVTDTNGEPFSQLEPIMATYAHLVGFCEDYKTVLHLHPKGAPPQMPNDRGGPELEFTFFATKPGFVRLFAQVQIGGVSKFAPFGVNVVP